METDNFMTFVEMPDQSRLEVLYYCTDTQLPQDQKSKFTQLFIQLHDCIFIMKIEKSRTENVGEIERIVQNKVINERGYWC